MNKSASLIFISVLVLQSILIALFHFYFHEPWRDEVQHFLIATSTKGLGGLFSALRYEGHPPFLHLLYRGLDHFVEPRVALALVSGIGYFTLSTSVFALLSTASTAPWLVVLASWLLSLSYVSVYEFGVIARGYGLGMGMAIAGLVCFIRLLKSPGDANSGGRRCTFALGLAFFCAAILTSVHSAILSACFLVPFFLNWFIEKKWRALVLTLAALALPLVILFSLLRDHTDRMPSPMAATPQDLASKLLWVGEQVQMGRYAAEMMSRLYQLFYEFSFPTHWWNFAYSEVPRWFGHKMFWTLLSLTLISFFFQKGKGRHRLLIVISLIFGALVFDFFFTFLYPASFRHRVFFTFPVFLLIARHWLEYWSPNLRQELKAQLPRVRLRSGTTLFAFLLLTGLSLSQIAASALALGADYFWYFSQTAMAPAFIPNSPNVMVAVDSDFTATAIALWNPKVKLYSRTGGGRPFTYAKWDRARGERKLRRKVLLGRLCDEVNEHPERSLYYLSVHPSQDAEYPFKEIFASSPLVPTAVLDERFRFYSVDCKTQTREELQHHAGGFYQRGTAAN